MTYRHAKNNMSDENSPGSVLTTLPPITTEKAASDAAGISTDSA